MSKYIKVKDMTLKQKNQISNRFMEKSGTRYSNIHKTYIELIHWGNKYSYRWNVVEFNFGTKRAKYKKYYGQRIYIVDARK